MRPPLHAHRALPVLVLAALAALAAAGLAAAFDPAYFQSDSAQYLSTARSILAGHGAATTIVWTAEHHLIGGVPVAQTNFPPGYPTLVAAVALAGVGTVSAALGVSIAAFCAVPFLVYGLARADGRPRATALGLGAAWLAVPFVWFNVLACMSEMTYVVLTLLGLLFLRRSEQDAPRRVAWLLLAGLCAGAAFTVRYAAFAFIGTLAAVLLARAARRRDAGSVLALLLVAAPAAALVLAIATHNYGLTGRLVGGLLADDGNTLAAVLHSVYWAFSEVLGFSKRDLLRGALPEWLLVALAVATLVWLASGVRLRVDRAAGRALATRTTAVVSLVYVTGSLGFYVLAASLHKSGVVAPRYLIPLLPFALLLVPYAAALVRVEASAGRRRAPAALRAAAMVVLLAGQLDVALAHRSRAAHNPYRTIEDALAHRFGPGTLGEFLSARVTPDAPLLGNEAQLMGVVLDRPVVGLPGSSYTRTVWTDDEARRTVARYGVAWVLVLPDLLPAGEPELANQPFFMNLKRGRVPSWLAPAFATNGVRLYQVTEAGA
jgi:hypothetical protein